jgi:hypothetical protein
MELFNCVLSAVSLKATTASAILLFIAKVSAVVAVPATSIIARINCEVLNSPLGVMTKEHSVLEIDDNNNNNIVVKCISHYG